MGPVYAARAGYGEDWVALFMSAGILGGAVLQWPLGVLSDRGDRRKVLAIAASYIVIASAVSLVGLVVVFAVTGLWDFLRDVGGGGTC